MPKIDFKTDAANLALRAAAIMGVMYGLGFLVVPQFMLQLSEDPGVPTTRDGYAGLEGFFLVLR
jgi:hypothetical protein